MLRPPRRRRRWRRRRRRRWRWRRWRRRRRRRRWRWRWRRWWRRRRRRQRLQHQHQHQHRRRWRRWRWRRRWRRRWWRRWRRRLIRPGRHRCRRVAERSWRSFPPVPRGARKRSAHTVEPFRVPEQFHVPASVFRSRTFVTGLSRRVFAASFTPGFPSRSFRPDFSLRAFRVACVTCRVRAVSHALVRRIRAPLFPCGALLRGVFPCRAGGRSGPPPRAPGAFRARRPVPPRVACAPEPLRALRRVTIVPAPRPSWSRPRPRARPGPEPARVPLACPPAHLRPASVRALTGHDGD